jgi:Domain of unknown function (DUF1939)
MKTDSVGQLILTGVPGKELDSRAERLFRRVQPGGFILFARNIETPAQLRKLIDDLRGLSEIEPIITIATAILLDVCCGFSVLISIFAGSSTFLLMTPGVLMCDRPAQAVTLVENHDVVRDTVIINDKLLAYAFILTHEGYPCVFWQDYFNWNLAQPDNQSGIAALVKVHEQNAAGSTQILFTDDNLYIMQRAGAGDQSGLVLVLNNLSTWNGTWVQTRWNNTRLVPAAWRGRDDLNVPEKKWTNESGWVNVWAPARGYVIYAPV